MKIRVSNFSKTLRALALIFGLAVTPPLAAQIGGGSNSILPLISLTAPDAAASESGDVGTFRLFRDGPTNLTLHVYWMLGGSASNGVDYAPLPSPTVEIPAGVREVRLDVNPIDDQLAEGPEHASTRLIPPPFGVPATYAIGYFNSATVVIYDNDIPPPTNRPPFVSMLSPADGSVFVAPVDVRLVAYAQDPEDGHNIKVEFFEGTNSLGLGTFIPSLCPTPYCPNFSLTWSNVPSGAYSVWAQATDSQGASSHSMPVRFFVVTNQPPPTPTNTFTLVSISAVDAIASEGTNCLRWTNYCWQPYPGFCDTNRWNGGGLTNTARFVVRRHGPTNSALVVHYRIGGTASNGLDYAALPGTVQIPAGRRAADVVVVPVDDNLPEKLETVVLGLRPPPDWPSNTPPPYLVGYPARAAAVIVDNYGPRPSLCWLPDRCFHIVHPGTNGTWVRIECSTNLIHWTGICTNMVSDGAVHFVDPDGDSKPNSFYRVVPSLPPPPDY